MHKTHKITLGLSTILLTSSLLGACHQLGFDNATTICTSSAAYSAGKRDANRGYSMHSSYAQVCPANQHVLERAYRDGYLFGLGHRGRG